MSLNSVDLPAPLGPITPTMPPGGSVKRQVLEQQLVAIGLGDALDLDDLAAEPLGHLDDDLRLAGRAVLLRGDCSWSNLRIRALDLVWRRLGALPDPLELVA